MIIWHSSTSVPLSLSRISLFHIFFSYMPIRMQSTYSKACAMTPASMSITVGFTERASPSNSTAGISGKRRRTMHCWWGQRPLQNHILGLGWQQALSMGRAIGKGLFTTLPRPANCPAWKSLSPKSPSPARVCFVDWFLLLNQLSLQPFLLPTTMEGVAKHWKWRSLFFRNMEYPSAHLSLWSEWFSLTKVNFIKFNS